MSPTLNYVLSSILADQQKKEEKYTHSKKQHKTTKEIRVTVIAFNATFNNISVLYVYPNYTRLKKCVLYFKKFVFVTIINLKWPTLLDLV
jgi:hypothetical protein